MTASGRETDLLALADELKAASEGLHVPPSVQSQRNIRAMNAMDRAAAALCLAASTPAPVADGVREALNNWVIIRDPGCVPVQKGPFKAQQIAGFLREVCEARPTSLVEVLTIHEGNQISVEDGPQCLEIIDGRSRSVAQKHRQRTSLASPANVPETKEIQSSDGGVEGHAETTSRSKWDGGSAQVKTASAVSVPAKAGRVRDDDGASPSAEQSVPKVRSQVVNQTIAGIKPGPSEANPTAAQVDAGVRDIDRVITTIEGVYNFTSEAGPLTNCGEWKYLKRILAALSSQPVAAAGVDAPLVRRMDEIDAARIGHDWLNAIAASLPKHPSNNITQAKVGNDGFMFTLWHKDHVQAAVVTVRDDANFTQLLRYRPAAPVADKSLREDGHD